ncbi:MAG: hypothetical protein ACE5E5_07640, partial [Phycisphaerae bacterium]
MNAHLKCGNSRPCCCCRAGRFFPTMRVSMLNFLVVLTFSAGFAMAETGLQRAQKRVAGEVASRGIDTAAGAVICPLPDPAVEVPVCALNQPSQCAGGVAGDICLPQSLFFDAGGNPQTDLCQCFKPDGLCGPVHVLPDPNGVGFRVSCDPNCPNGVDLCTLHFDGVDTGQVLMSSTAIPAGALITCGCGTGGGAACPLPSPPIIPICDQNQAAGQCQTGTANDTCSPLIVIADGVGGFFAELCECVPPGGTCGPVTVEDTVGFPVFSCVEACPDPPGGNCEIHIDGVASGMASVPVFDVPANSAVTCQCAPAGAQNFCIYEVTCAEGDCTNCPAAIAGACFDTACPGGTCAVLAGMTASCGAAVPCCIEFGAFTCADPTGLPPCPTVTNDCTCTPPQLGACCFGDGTCAEVLQADCPPPAVWQGPGTTCGPIGACCDPTTGQCTLEYQICCQGTWHQGDCLPPEGCCLPDGTCAMLDPQCCTDIGGTAQGPNSSCSPTGPEACCFPDGTCSMLDPLCCADRGGTSLGAGSVCLGDLNQNGVDDACETTDVCPLPLPPVIPLCQQQQPTACTGGTVNDLCLPWLVFIDAAGQLVAEGCQCFTPGDSCGPIGVEQVAGTNEVLLSCSGLCQIPGDDCLLHVGGVSTGQAQAILSNLPSGQPITCECTQPTPQLGACCFGDGTCAEVL